ncbi:hypothetical protein V8C86DRAFT_3141573 [Haematococcus lacustris]
MLWKSRKETLSGGPSSQPGVLAPRICHSIQRCSALHCHGRGLIQPAAKLCARQCLLPCPHAHPGISTASDEECQPSWKVWGWSRRSLRTSSSKPTAPGSCQALNEVASADGVLAPQQQAAAADVDEAAPQQQTAAADVDKAAPQQQAAAAYGDSSPPQEQAAAAGGDSSPPQQQAAAFNGNEAAPKQLAAAADVDEAAPQQQAAAVNGDEAAPEQLAAAADVDKAAPQQQAAGRRQAPAPRALTRSIYIWPRLHPVHHRPPFLEQYPAEPGQFNINSFLGYLDVHHGKMFVPRERYSHFLREYNEAIHNGYRLFLAEVYKTNPFRYFVELDFDWDMDEKEVLKVLPDLLDVLIEVVAQHYHWHPDPVKEPYAIMPSHVISMRTPYKVHLNFPDIVTTELQAHMCRDEIITACKAKLRDQVGTDFKWDKVVDFPHGSFRMLGSRKSHKLDKDPPHVLDKAYYPVKYVDGVWSPIRINEPVLRMTSIMLPPAQQKKFEQSSTYLAMIYQDHSLVEARKNEKMTLRAEISVNKQVVAAELALMQASEEQRGDGGREASQSPSNAAPVPRLTKARMPRKQAREQRTVVEEAQRVLALAEASGPPGAAYLEALQKVRGLMMQVQELQQQLTTLLLREKEGISDLADEVQHHNDQLLSVRRQIAAAQRQQSLMTNSVMTLRSQLLNAGEQSAHDTEAPEEQTLG